MSELDFRPKTRSVPARLIRVGQVVMESAEHPCTIVEIRSNLRRDGLRIYAQYVWQRDTEPAWLLGTFHPDTLLEKAI
ncbi:MAG: hypothetical protein JWR57_1354 [Mycetocola sp.]|nr:hypothetical protein [Mycetocola sp.]